MPVSTLELTGELISHVAALDAFKEIVKDVEESVRVRELLPLAKRLTEKPSAKTGKGEPANTIATTIYMEVTFRRNILEAIFVIQSNPTFFKKYVNGHKEFTELPKTL